MSENDELPTEESEEPRRYAGDRVSVAALEQMLTAGVRYIPVQITPLDKVKTTWGAVPVKRPPSLVIVEALAPSGHGPEARQVTVYNLLKTFTRSFVDLATTHEVTVLTGRQGKEMTARFDTHRTSNFHVVRNSVFSGADPEVFIEAKGEVIPAFHFLPSKADGKLGMGNESTRGAYYWDGFQAEFNTVAGHCLVYHGESLYAGLYTLADAARGYSGKARLSTKSVVTIPQEVIDASKEEHVAFGCMPSLNAYDLQPRQSLDGRATPLRFAGGHIHLGVGKVTNHRDIVRAMDAVLGVACVSLFAQMDNPIRRQFYGLPGEYRLPVHGIEYRTLSNAWLCHPAIYHMVFDLARRAKDLGQQGMGHMWKADERETVETILNCDVKQARVILERNKGAFKSLMSALGGYVDPAAADAAHKVWANGVESLVKDPADIHTNWCLDKGWVDRCTNPYGNWSAAYGAIRQGRLI